MVYESCLVQAAVSCRASALSLYHLRTTLWFVRGFAMCSAGRLEVFVRRCHIFKPVSRGMDRSASALRVGWGVLDVELVDVELVTA